MSSHGNNAAQGRENRPPMVLLPPGTPLRPHSPSAKPSLALQRDHSACASFSSPLTVRKTRQANEIVVPPPCHSCVVSPRRQQSVSRRLLSAVKAGLSHSETSQRSASASTVAIAASTSDLETTASSNFSNDKALVETDLDIAAGKMTSLYTHIPYIELDVKQDINRAAVDSTQDIWVAATAKVKLKPINVGPQAAGDASGVTLGKIRACRLVVVPRCCVLEVLGHRSAKEMKVGDTCELFVRAQIPQAQPTASVYEADTLMTELESKLGVLEDELMVIELHYKHSLLYSSQSIWARHFIKVKRYDCQSR